MYIVFGIFIKSINTFRINCQKYLKIYKAYMCHPLYNWIPLDISKFSSNLGQVWENLSVYNDYLKEKKNIGYFIS